MVMESIGIAVERKASLAIVTIVRPDRLNAFNQAMFEALGDAAAINRIKASSRALRRQVRLEH